MQFSSFGKKVVLAGSLLLLSLVTGCAQSGGILGGSASNVSSDSIANMVQNYGDIELPMEMKLVPENTMGLDTDSFQGGIYQYKGRVDIDSLREYLIASMRNHKWKLMGEARYDYVMLAFTKPNRTCMIVIRPGFLGNTTTTFYITVDVAAASHLNPFGEPVNSNSN